MLTIYEEIFNDGSKLKLEDYKYRYPLKQLSPNNIFPVEHKPSERDADSEDYRKLFFEFINAIEKLEHKNNIRLWLEHFDSCFMSYASSIPAATVGKVKPNVSLYDHSKTTSAIAAALYQYHLQTDTLNIDNIKSYDEKKFLMIVGNFSGIQDFIFSEGGSTNKASAKLLRGRSFAVSLIIELAADMLCRELGLPAASIVFNAAGKFTILAPNTENSKNKMKEVETKINNWLIKYFYGQCSIGFSCIEASPKDFVFGQYKQLKDKLSAEVERKKFSKIDMDKHGGSIKDYLDKFDNTLDDPLCPFCGKRPSIDKVKVNEKEEDTCGICKDHIFIGENIVKENRLAITTLSADLKGEKLSIPIFDEYQLAFTSGDLNKFSRDSTLLKHWDIGIQEDGEVTKEITAKFINGYVPKYEEEDNNDDRIFCGGKSDKKKEELITLISAGVPKTFEHIAKMALNLDEQGKCFGIEALGILKADVDNLGMIMRNGIKENMQCISLDASLSRQLNNFFTVFLPYELKNKFKDIYTVFGGGDDLFLIGPWNMIIDAAGSIRESFKKYVCSNCKITISMGIAVYKPNVPVRIFAEKAEEALKSAKYAGRNRITLFDETVEWNIFDKLEDVKETLNCWIKDETINKAMLYRFNEITEMVKKEKDLKNKGGVHIEDMECLKWRSMLLYTIARNVGHGLKDEERTALINEVSEKVTKWFEEFGGAMKIPLWQIIYSKRRV